VDFARRNNDCYPVNYGSLTRGLLKQFFGSQYIFQIIIITKTFIDIIDDDDDDDDGNLTEFFLFY